MKAKPDKEKGFKPEIEELKEPMVIINLSRQKIVDRHPKTIHQSPENQKHKKQAKLSIACFQL